MFQHYAASLSFGGIPQNHGPKDKRLIDIEIRADGSGLANYVYDVVWVQDEGDFTLESWFVPAMTEAELHQLPDLAPHGIVALDMERYPKGEEWRYSVILQRNAGKFGWEVLTGVTLDEVLDTAERRGLRVVDLDYAIDGPISCQAAPGQACTPATFDAILVADSGSNAIETRFWANMTSADIEAKRDQGFQVIDREDGQESDVMVWVRPGLPFDHHGSLFQEDVIFQHGHHGRVIDLEHQPGPYALVHLAASGAPASPGLAATREDDTRDRQHQIRDRNKHAAGTADRDRKAKEKQSGKRDNRKKGGRR